MKIWVGVTDKNWYEHLIRLAPEEVNFWQPSGSRTFRVLQPGEPFLFKLHSPENFIVGGGFFVRYSALPASLAWDAFEGKNGVDSLVDLISRVRRYRVDDRSIDPVIGCNVLAEPFFLQRSEWIPMPPNWAANIVQGKSYDTDSEEGRELWSAVQQFIAFGQRVRDSKRNSNQVSPLWRGIPYPGALRSRRISGIGDRCVPAQVRCNRREDTTSAGGSAYQALCDERSECREEWNSSSIGPAQIV